MVGLKGVYNLMHDDEADQIDHLIEVFIQLQRMSKDLDDPLCNRELIMGLMISLIKTTKVPEVTILPSIKGIGLA